MHLIRTDDLYLLTGILPPLLQNALEALPKQELLEVVMDLGRLPQARLPSAAHDLSDQPVTRTDIAHVMSSIGEFGGDNRAGIEGTLHRISAIRNRRGEVVGLTLRVGRAVFGTIDRIRDLVETGASTLLLGRPGIGKTTKLREVARVLADQCAKRVIVIDTSNEIAGDGDIPHPAIGSARRMQVPHPDRQHAVMIEAVENHMPEVIVIDEIGTAADAAAARTIAERGVQLIGTAHGNTLENMVLNPTLSDLVGGVQTVTLSDEEARLRGTQKTVTERKGSPTFTAVVEIVDRESLVVHSNTARAVDRLLSGRPAGGELRSPHPEVISEIRSPAPAEQRPVQEAPTAPAPPDTLLRIYPYAVSPDLVERVIRDLRLEARTVSRPERADLILALRSRSDDLRLQRIVGVLDLPVYELKKNTTAQIRRLLQSLDQTQPKSGAAEEEVEAAIRETEDAIERVASEGIVIGLKPRPASVRRVQHRLVSQHRLQAHSVGRDPDRHVVIRP